MALDLIISGLDFVFEIIKDFIVLVLVIIYTIVFFVVQYYLIKGYIFIFKGAFSKIIAIYGFFSKTNTYLKLKDLYSDSFN